MKTIQLRESELINLIDRVIKEQTTVSGAGWPECPKSCQQLIPNFKTRIGQMVSSKPNPCNFLRNKWQSILSQSNQFAQQFNGWNYVPPTPGAQTPTVQDRCNADRFTCKLNVINYHMQQQQGGCPPPPR